MMSDKDIAVAILENEFPEQQELLALFKETHDWKFESVGSTLREKTLNVVREYSKSDGITAQIAAVFMENGVFRFPASYAASIGTPEVDGPRETLIPEAERVRRKDNACKNTGSGDMREAL